MILVEEPWYNEPGREHMPNKAVSRKYNAQIQGCTIEHAMLEWLNTRLAPPEAAVPGMSGCALDVGGAGSGFPRRYPTRAAVSSGSASGATVGAGVKDDPVWGEVVRKHFAANGKAIVETVKKWKQAGIDKEVVAGLTEALAAHGFV